MVEPQMIYVAFQPPGVQAMESFAKKHQDKVFRLALEDGFLEVLRLAMVAGFGRLTQGRPRPRW